MAPKNWEDEFPKVRIPAPNIILRCNWDSDAKGEGDFLPLPVTDLLLTFSGGPECYTDKECVNALHALRQRDIHERGMPDIQYNYYIGSNGIVYEGRGWHIKSTKDPKFSHLDGVSIDFAFIGDFQNKDPSEIMTQAGSDFLKYLLENGYVKEEFEVTPLGMSRASPDELDGKGNEKTVFHYGISREPSDIPGERLGIPKAESQPTIPFKDSVNVW